MDKIERNSFFYRNGTFLFLLLIGLILRILFIEFQGLSNDELSAWYRTRFVMGEDFWRLGVSQGDMHPAFYQVFLWYWVRLFGDSEFSFRATSLLFFAANLTLIYQIGSRFFSKHSANLISALYVSLGFLIVNTTTARPYNSGVFFLLLTFYLVLILRQRKNQFGWGRTALLLLAFLGAMTSHYFAFLSVGLLGLCGLFYTGKEGRKYLLVAGAVAFGLFGLLHFSITQEQLSHGGLGWLGTPDWYWFFDFLKQVFQNSYWVLLFGVGVLLYAKKGTTRSNSAQGFSLIVMIVICSAAYLISIFYTPILRELVFQFILPFVFFGLIGPLEVAPTDKLKRLLPYGVVVFFGLHSIFVYKLFEPIHYGVFREIAWDIELNQRYDGKENTTYAINSNNVDYLNYYLRNSPLSEEIVDWSSQETVYQLSDRVKNAKTQHFHYCWINNYHVPMYLEVIRRNFAYGRGINYFNSGSYYFSKPANKEREVNAANGSTLMELAHIGTEYPKRLVMDIRIGDQYDWDEFFMDHEVPVKEIRDSLQKNDYVLLELEGVVQKTDEFYVVIEGANEKGQMIMNGDVPLFYRAYNQQRLNSSDSLKSMYTAFSIPEDLKDTDLLKIYCWNPKKGTILVKNLKIYAVEDNYHPINYSLE